MDFSFLFNEPEWQTVVTTNKYDLLYRFFMWPQLQYKLKNMKKYTQNLLKSCVKNPVGSNFYTLGLKLYMVKRNVLKKCITQKQTHVRKAWKNYFFLVDFDIEK